MMNRKGQTAYGFVAMMGVVMLVWVLGLSKIISFWGAHSADAANLTGLEGFIFNNLNMFIFFTMVISLFIWFRLNQ